MDASHGESVEFLQKALSRLLKIQATLVIAPGTST